MIEIFNRFFPSSLLTAIWDGKDASHWVYGYKQKQRVLNKGKCSFKLIYTKLATFIKITSEQKAPKEGQGNSRLLRQATLTQYHYFAEKYPRFELPGHTTLEVFWARYQIPYGVFGAIMPTVTYKVV